MDPLYLSAAFFIHKVRVGPLLKGFSCLKIFFLKILPMVQKNICIHLYASFENTVLEIFTRFPKFDDA